MADPLGAAGSIVGIAAFGLKFATTLQTYVEAVADAHQSLKDVASDVNATASALEQLHEIINASSDANGKPIANGSGLQQVVQLASQCKQVYTAIISLIAKAAGLVKDDNGEISLDTLDLDSLKVTSLTRRLKWPFKEPRIKKHQQELRWLKISLLLHLQVMELAKSKMMTPTSSLRLETWERETALQATSDKLQRRRESYAERMVANRKRQKKRKMRRQKALNRTSPSTIDEAFASSYPISPTRQPPPPSKAENEVQDTAQLNSRDVDAEAPRLSEYPLKEVETKSYFPGDSAPGGEVFGVTSVLPNPQPVPVPQTVEINEKVENNGSDSAKQGPIPEPGPKCLSTGNAKPVETPVTGTQDSTKITIDSSRIDDKENSSKIKKEDSSDTSKPARSSSKRNSKERKLSRGTFDTFPWLSNIFARRAKPSRDWDSQELEAYFIEGDLDVIRKLPFGHQSLIRMVERAVNSSPSDISAQYASLTRAQRESVDRAMAEANRLIPRARTCVAITTQSKKTSDIVVYFSVGPPVQPVHLKYQDLYFPFPFELCRTWEGMDRLIKQALGGEQRALDGGRHASIAYLVDIGQYRLKGIDNHEILPVMWSSTVQPGLVVFLSTYTTTIYYGNGLPIARASSPMPQRLSRSESSDSEFSAEESESGLFALNRRGFAASEYSDSELDDQEEEEPGIIDFEQEREDARIGVGGLLKKWTNVFDDSVNQQ